MVMGKMVIIDAEELSVLIEKTMHKAIVMALAYDRMPDNLTPNQVSDVLGVTPSAVRQQVQKGVLANVGTKGKIQVPKRQVFSKDKEFKKLMSLID